MFLQSLCWRVSAKASRCSATTSLLERHPYRWTRRRLRRAVERRKQVFEVNIELITLRYEAAHEKRTKTRCA